MRNAKRAKRERSDKTKRTGFGWCPDSVLALCEYRRKPVENIFGWGSTPSGTLRFKKIDCSFWNGETFRFADYRITSFSIKKYLHNVAFPLACVIVLSVITTLIPYFLISNVVLKFFVVIVVSALATITYSYVICFDQAEKILVNQFVNKIIARFK